MVKRLLMGSGKTWEEEQDPRVRYKPDTWSFSATCVGQLLNPIYVQKQMEAHSMTKRDCERWC